jgi:magnesium-transporting ATPase (P-type)
MARDAFKVDYKEVRSNEFSITDGDRIFAFNSTRKLMSTVVFHDQSSAKASDNSTCMVYTKGAPEIVLAACTHYLDSAGNKKPLAKNGAVLKDIHATLLHMSEASLRTVALAHAHLDIDAAHAAGVEPEELEK